MRKLWVVKTNFGLRKAYRSGSLIDVIAAKIERKEQVRTRKNNREHHNKLV